MSIRHTHLHAINNPETPAIVDLANVTGVHPAISVYRPFGFLFVYLPVSGAQQAVLSKGEPL